MIETEDSKKQKKLKIILVVTVLLTVSILGWRFIRKGGNILPSFDSGFVSTSEDFFMEQIMEGGSLGSIAGSINLNLDVLDDFRFENLKSHGDLPIKIDEVGRDNPFIPYSF
jgi:hypothetical protein